ncbi:MAG: sulfatase-like hydrolase/transferase [Verrucomicrobia bacterium]|nr:sulfatase-like hydrolase/transferase [Verrucomicrobiota bacterium]
MSPMRLSRTAFAWLCVLCAFAFSAFAADRPNILILLADDMGFSDAGCYGGEIATPNLDALAKGGLRFTQFYNTARCWPSRAAILTGYYAQAVRRDAMPGVPGSGGRGVRPAWAKLLPEMLKPLGYRTYHSGKWHVDGEPTKNGFDHSYLLEDHNRNFNPQNLSEDGEKLPAVKSGSGYYTTTAFADHAVKCLKEHAEKFSDRPFFQYLCFTVPHFPLQAPAADIARYQGKYIKGWNVVAQERWERMTKLGLVHHALPTMERFLSDNGASAEIMVRGDGNDLNAAPGSAASFLCLGPGWSSAANTPLRRHKKWVHEGGISTPLIAHWPKGIAARGELRHNPGHLVDLVPTIFEVAGGKTFAPVDGQPVPPAPGKSLVPVFKKDGTVSHEYFWWMHEKNRALRVGDWKIVASGNAAPWELYDLSKDRGESNDLASQNPEKVRELAAIWEKHTEEFRQLALKDLPPDAAGDKKGRKAKKKGE